MIVTSGTIHLATRGSGDIIDITYTVNEQVIESGIVDGTVTVFVPGSTGAVTTIEYEAGVIQDLQAAFDRAVPVDMFYEHHRRWQDGNGHSHVRAAWLGPSLTIPIINRQLTLGTWQQIVLIDFDNVPRQRDLVIQIMGNQ